MRFAAPPGWGQAGGHPTRVAHCRRCQRASAAHASAAGQARGHLGAPGACRCIRGPDHPPSGHVKPQTAMDACAPAPPCWRQPARPPALRSPVEGAAHGRGHLHALHLCGGAGGRWCRGGGWRGRRGGCWGWGGGCGCCGQGGSAASGGAAARWEQQHATSLGGRHGPGGCRACTWVTRVPWALALAGRPGSPPQTTDAPPLPPTAAAAAHLVRAPALPSWWVLHAPPAQQRRVQPWWVAGAAAAVGVEPETGAGPPGGGGGAVAGWPHRGCVQQAEP